MIKKFQNQRLGILRDIQKIEAFRTPDHVELTEFMAIDFDLLQNCAERPRDHSPSLETLFICMIYRMRGMWER